MSRSKSAPRLLGSGGRAMLAAIITAPDDELIRTAIADGRITHLPHGVASGALHAGDFNRQRR